MKEKLVRVLGSVSFWLSVIGGIALVLAQYEVIPYDMAYRVAGWAGFSVTKRTVDKGLE